VLLRVLGVETHACSGIITGSLGVALILTALHAVQERCKRLASRKAIEGESWRQASCGCMTSRQLGF